MLLVCSQLMHVGAAQEQLPSGLGLPSLILQSNFFQTCFFVLQLQSNSPILSLHPCQFPGASRRVSIVRAFVDEEKTAEITESMSASATEFADKVGAWWEASDEKPTIVAVGFAGLLALYFTNTVVTAVDHLPILSTVFELIGLAFTGWTGYRYFLVDGEKDKMAADVKGVAAKIGVEL